MPDLNKWVDVEATQAVSRHTSAGIFAIVCFGLLWLFVHYILPHSWVQLWIETIDEFILVGLFSVARRRCPVVFCSENPCFSLATLGGVVFLTSGCNT